MTDPITQALGQNFSMYYHPAVAVDRFLPVCTLDQTIQQVNQALAQQGRNFETWSAGHQDQAARLLWVNWIYQNLEIEPIRKPILAHCEQSGLRVDCGDTRLMAVSLRPKITHVPAVITVPNHCEIDWTPVRSGTELCELIGLDPAHSVILATPTSAGKDYAIEWMEIGDQTTAHHLHSVDQRLTMLQNYVNQQDQDFVFDRAWFIKSINWSEYQ